MKKSLYITQLLFVMCIYVLLSFYLQRSVLNIIDIGAFLFLLLFLIVPIFFIYGIHKTISYFKVAFNQNAEDQEKKEALAFFKTLIGYLILASLTIALAATCLLLSNLDIDDVTIGSFLVIALLTPLQSFVFCLAFFYPLRSSLEKNIAK